MSGGTLLGKYSGQVKLCFDFEVYRTGGVDFCIDFNQTGSANDQIRL